MKTLPTEKARLEALLQAFSGCKIAVIGDVVLDEFVRGRTVRVSREAPVLILRREATEHWPGCAGNAARNAAALGAQVTVAGLVGADAAGAALVEQLSGCGIDVRHLVRGQQGKTACKTRFLAGDLHTVQQQVMRLDQEAEFPDIEQDRRALHTAIVAAIETAAAVLLCDYGGAVLAPPTRTLAIATARARRIPVVADSRYALQGFTGVTCATPNETEIEPIVGRPLEDDAAVEAAGEELRRRLEAPYLVVTRGRLGMTVFDGGSPRHLAAFGDEALDVAGAGDTVAASLTLALACGGSVHDAARLANYAASRVVLERGTAVTDRDAIRRCMEHDPKLS